MQCDCGTHVPTRIGPPDVQDKSVTRRRRNPYRDRTYRERVRQLRKQGGVCHLCGIPIDPMLPRDHAGAFSADHLKPLSLGGPLKNPSNLRPAHSLCNGLRGNRDFRDFDVVAEHGITAQIVNPNGYEQSAALAEVERLVGFSATQIRHAYSDRATPPTVESLALRSMIDARILELHVEGVSLLNLGRALGLGIKKAGGGRRRCAVLRSACRRARAARQLQDGGSGCAALGDALELAAA